MPIRFGVSATLYRGRRRRGQLREPVLSSAPFPGRCSHVPASSRSEGLDLPRPQYLGSLTLMRLGQ